MSTKTWKLTKSLRRPGWLVLIGPYDEDFIDDMKVAVPAPSRRWDPKIKAWLVEERVRIAVEQVIKKHTVPADDPVPVGRLGAEQLIDRAAKLGSAAEGMETFQTALELAAEDADAGSLGGGCGVTWTEDGNRYTLIIGMLVRDEATPQLDEAERAIESLKLKLGGES